VRRRTELAGGPTLKIPKVGPLALPVSPPRESDLSSGLAASITPKAGLEHNTLDAIFPLNQEAL
jgi:hypothetical protein